MDATYSILGELPHLHNGYKLDMHEFKLEDDGSTAMVIFTAPIRHSAEDAEHRWGFADAGFSAINLSTGMASFEWDASQHIFRNTSSQARPPVDSHKAWDWL